jgi:hypothetical protein
MLAGNNNGETRAQAGPAFDLRPTTIGARCPKETECLAKDRHQPHADSKAAPR